MTQRIVLTRHGRSAHTHTGLLDLAGFIRWREAYEAAGIDERDEPPQELRTLASGSAIVVTSEAPRAAQSARLLAPSREIRTSPLLRELTLAPPNLRGVRMPLIFWAIAIGVQWLIRLSMRRPHVSAEELERSREAADWLSDLAERHGTIVAVTHASFRSLVVERLMERGWRSEVPRKRSAHWSSWSLWRE